MSADIRRTAEGVAERMMNGPPICTLCKRFNMSDTWPKGNPTCEAFPGGIPDGILHRLADHRKPFKGDHGIQFEPRDGVMPADVDEWAAQFAPRRGR